MKKIIVVGSLNMDLTIESDRIPARGETMHGHDFLMNEGGKGGNQAVAAVRSEAFVSFIGGIGDDVFGSKLKGTLNKAGINTDYLQIFPNEPTGIAMIIRSGGDNRIILNSGANFKIDTHKMTKDLKAIGQAGDILITQFENETNTTFSALSVAKEIGMYTILNPAPAKAFSIEKYPLIDLIIVNQSECQTLTGIYPTNNADCQEAFTIFRERGTKKAIITLGSEGSTALEEENLIFVPAYHVNAIDTTAAGDSFIGAIASRLAFGDTLKNSMIYATKTAALTVMKQGALTSIPSKKEIEAFL